MVVPWRKGDTVETTMQGKTYTIKVEEDTLVKTYATDGTASFVTPSNAEEGSLTLVKSSLAWCLQLT